MLNFRKLLHDFSSGCLKEGKHLLESDRVSHASVQSIIKDTLKYGYEVEGAFKHTYHGHLDIGLKASEIHYSDCDCSKKYDCEHIAAACLYLEAHYDEILAKYACSHEKKSITKQKRDTTDKKVEIALANAREKTAKKTSQAAACETLSEYRHAHQVLAENAFFDEPGDSSSEPAQLHLILQPNQNLKDSNCIEISLVLRLESRTKPIGVSNLRDFFESVEFEEPQLLSSRLHTLSYKSFSKYQQKILRHLALHAYENDNKEKSGKTSLMTLEALGSLLEMARNQALADHRPWTRSDETEVQLTLEGFYLENLDNPLKLGQGLAQFAALLHRMELKDVKIMMEMFIKLKGEKVSLQDAWLLPSRRPGLLYQNFYYAFEEQIARRHLKASHLLHDLVIPEPLLGTLLEIGLPVFKNICPDTHCKSMSCCVTLPCVAPKAKCSITYTNGKMEVEMSFIYENKSVPAISSKLTLEDLDAFISKEAVFARDIWYEKRLLNQMFADFQRDEAKGVFMAKSDRSIVDFMTRLVPLLRDRVEFDCPANLLDQFIYDNTKISLRAKKSSKVHEYDIEVKIEGPLEGVHLCQIWDCISSERCYFELSSKETKHIREARPKVLVIDLKTMKQVARFFDDMGLESFTSHTTAKPLWTLAHLDLDHLKQLPFEVTLDEEIKEIQAQLWNTMTLKASPIPKEIQADLRSYQLEGVHWLEKLRRMHLAGILADDMGLGKTLQAIVAISQAKIQRKNFVSFVVCPTSLVYNWKEEIARFNPKLRALVIDGTPAQRKKLAQEIPNYDVVVTSYSLLQKDLDNYQEQKFGYIILDEAQNIKNRHTQNAKSVRGLHGLYRLALTGTPVENSLDELWSLFDFLMPGFMSSYERFVEKYIKRAHKEMGEKTLAMLKRKMAPFLLRRMKTDVLDELPPVNEIIYHCHLTPAQRTLYNDYAASARKELTALVAREGFDRVRIHVLATLTRLKQICCHPAIVVNQAESAESAKYNLFWQVVENILLSNKKAVVFSQYTKMLTKMRQDLDNRSIAYCYLDGASKNRLEIVKKFNESTEIPLFLVSLKAGGTGLNLTGADTVIHYDLWWNPAVEEQATDRVHRMGQKSRVSSYKLITLGTIEEKIVQLQNRKRGLVRQLVIDDDEAMEKLTWEEVLQLLET